MLAKLSPSRPTGEKWNDRAAAPKDGVKATTVLETDARPDRVMMNALCMVAEGVQPLPSEAVGKQNETVAPFHIGLIFGISPAFPIVRHNEPAINTVSPFCWLKTPRPCSLPLGQIHAVRHNATDIVRPANRARHSNGNFAYARTKSSRNL